jgi:hypothetical protein
MVRDAASKAVRLDPAERDSYASLVREFKVILAKDANIHCAATAAMASEAMAKALRSDFAGNAKLICPNLLGRFKEKNPVMSKAAESCLQSFATYCYSLKDVSDDIAAALSVKNPKVRGLVQGLACGRGQAAVGRGFQRPAGGTGSRGGICRGHGGLCRRQNPPEWRG